MADQKISDLTAATALAATDLTTIVQGGTNKKLAGNALFLSCASSKSSPADPAGTTSGTGVMMGLAGAITPTLTGRVLLIANGSAKSDTGNSGGKIAISYGTGVAPANGVAATGTATGSAINYSTSDNRNQMPWSSASIVTGLTPGTAYWLDIALSASSGNTANIYDITIVAVEF